VFPTRLRGIRFQPSNSEIIFLVALTLILSLSVKPLNGTFIDKNGMTGLTFNGSKVIMKSPFSGGVEMKYEIEART
jgi:hypothetical protein